jgi:hypothetical protein
VSGRMGALEYLVSIAELFRKLPGAWQ